MKTILVTGANGYIGSHTVRALLDQGEKVIATDIRAERIDKRAQIVVGDALSGEPPEIFAAADACLHMVWQDGFNHNAPSHMEKLSAHFAFLKKMIELGVPQIAVMGSMHEVGYWEGEIREDTPTNPSSLYGIAKDALRRSLGVFLSDKRAVFQWLRAFYIYGQDFMNHSVFTKILQAAQRGDALFPFNSGKNQYDFIHVDDLAKQIAAAVTQRETAGIIHCCTGAPVKLGDKVEQFIKENGLNIQLQYGAFPERPYDSPAIWGDAAKIGAILSRAKGARP